jgi:hypothetical protein
VFAILFNPPFGLEQAKYCCPYRMAFATCSGAQPAYELPLQLGELFKLGLLCAFAPISGEN